MTFPLVHLRRAIAASRRRLRGAMLATAAALLLSPTVATAQLGNTCNPLDPAHCMLPFPSSFYEVDDPQTVTGKRIRIPTLATPANLLDVPGAGLQVGKPIDTTEWNRHDGYSLGSLIITRVPGLDMHQTWGTADKAHAGTPNSVDYFDYRDHIADIGRFMAADAPIVLLNARTGQRHAFWSELDTHADVTPETQTLLIRPAANLDPATRYIVALRRMRDADGNVIPAGEAFAAYRDGRADDDRAAAFEALFATLDAAGIDRGDLYLAWDFTTASTESLTGRMLHMRDVAFAQLGDTTMGDGIVQGESPAFTVESHEIIDEGEFGRYRRVKGRVTVPNFLDRIQVPLTGLPIESLGLPISGDVPLPFSRLYYDPSDGPGDGAPRTGDGLPDINPRQPETSFDFTCDVPLDIGPSYPMTYGHGLVGAQNQIGDARWPRRFGFMACGADWWGMSSNDLPSILVMLLDLSLFPSLPDRSQQGFLNFLFLARAATHPQGFATHPCFQANDDCTTAGDALVRTATATETPVFFDGNSQGGILGPGMIAVSPDIDRGILGVPGINYSTLLNRSVDWEGLYAIPNYLAYRDPIERQLIYNLIQMLWDRSEGNGYAHRLTTNPLPNTPPHEVMLQVAYSDHQVTNHAAEVFARTIGAPIMLPGLPAGRHWEEQPYYTATARYPYQGSALIYWDSDNPRPPNGNVPADAGTDPHSHPRREPGGGWQEAHFLLTGEMVDICNGGDYITDDHPAAEGQVQCPIPDRPVGAYRPVAQPAAATDVRQATPSRGGGSLEWIGGIVLLLAAGLRSLRRRQTASS